MMLESNDRTGSCLCELYPRKAELEELYSFEYSGCMLQAPYLVILAEWQKRTLVSTKGGDSACCALIALQIFCYLSLDLSFIGAEYCWFL